LESKISKIELINELETAHQIIDQLKERDEEHKRIEQKLVASELRYRRLFETAQDGILIIDAISGKINDVNPFLMKMLGYPKEYFLGKQLWEIGLFKNIDASQEAFRELQINGYIRYEDLPLERKDGRSMYVEFVSNVYSVDGERVIQCNIRDITERKLLEEGRNLATQKLRELYEIETFQRQELEDESRAKSLFTDVLAHELRTPLTPIVASAGMLADLKEGDDEFRKRLIDIINTSSQMMTTRLEELLDMARYSRGTFKLRCQPTDLGSFINGVVCRFKPTLEIRKQHLIENIPETLPMANIDASRLEQVIINLLSNASKFSPELGTITISASVDSHQLKIDTHDCGIGISLESQKRLFEPYYRVEQDRQSFTGLGLGLAISKKIIDAYGGKIWLVSKPGEGSTFSFLIPLEEHSAKIP
jgi:PAS domain S-box-containing protein